MHALYLAAALTFGAQPAAPTFGDDADFLAQHTDAFVLQRGDSQLAVVPAYQARVMTSTWGGRDGFSNGWLNRELIASGKIQPHINVYGGEDRFWLGPEGGQFAIFFKPGDDYNVDDWQTPAPIDTEPYELVSKTDSSADFKKEFDLTNKSGATFRVQVRRKVELLDRAEAAKFLATDIPDTVQTVVYQTRNEVTNAGDAPWKRETGLLAIWILGMYKPSPQTTIVIPVKPGPESELGPIVTDSYFGEVPDDRLKTTDTAVFFKGDGNMRGKLGVNPKRSKAVVGSYDAANQVLTVVTYNAPQGDPGYVNNLWKDQEDPYNGDAIMVYNDGPMSPGKPPLGPFYELETSSPALDLAPKASYTHDHRTVHLHGPEPELDALAQKIFGVDLKTINSALK